VVGYSRLMGVDEEGTHRRLAAHVKDLIEPKIAANHGRLIRTAGDGFLVEFDSAVDAVRCGLDVQRELAKHNAGVPADRRIQLRIGINAGDVIVDNQDIYGNSVNIAARLEGLAEPGGVSVTRGVRDQLEGQPNLSFQDRGERRVKNIARPIRVYRVKYVEEQPKGFWYSLIAHGRRSLPVGRRFGTRATVLSTAILAAAVTFGALGMPAWRDQWRTAPRSSIMVLPFNNFGGDAEQGYVADAITDDLTTDLARLKGIFVIARGTAFTFKGRSVDAREVGRECGVRYLLEGSIIRVGSRLETNVQLIDAQTGAHVWADRFESDVSDLFQLLSAITGRIAASLDIQLAKAEGERTAANPDAVDLRMRAMALYINGVTPEHLLGARRLLERSVRLDPSSAESWSWLAEILVVQYLHRWNNAGNEELNQAEEAVGKALAIDPSIAQAYHTEGLVRRAKGDHDGALEAFNRALELNPNLPRALAEKGDALTLLGRPAEAPPLVEKAIQLSPRDPSLGGFYWIIGRALFVSGDYGDAIPWLRKSIALRPNDWSNRLYLVSAYVLDQRQDEAKKVLQEFNNNPQFAGYTLERVASDLRAIPNDNALIVAARQKLREGLQLAGMLAR
jgi:adenylate cyclase